MNRSLMLLKIVREWCPKSHAFGIVRASCKPSLCYIMYIVYHSGLILVEKG